MKKTAQFFRHARLRLTTMAGQAWDLLLVCVLLIISYSEGEEEVQEITPENETH